MSRERSIMAGSFGQVAGDTTGADKGFNRLTIGGFVGLSAWCGLVAGLLEVATIIVRKQAFDENHLYGMSRHFTWLVPASEAGLFVIFGLLGSTASWAWPRWCRWLVVHGLCTITILPVFLTAFSRVYGVAWLVVALGIAMRVVAVLESKANAFRRVVRFSFPVVLGIVVLLAAAPWVGDRMKLARERARGLPPSGSANVLLIVLDTVAARHLSLHGYRRPTSTTLVELAERGIRFDSARATCSWTLPSHATMFTGRWMHELSVGWLNPLDGSRATLAEYLGEHGYATAGFVANTVFCARDTGLDRGFTHYEDFIFPKCTALKSAVLVNRLLTMFGRILPFVEERPSLAWLQSFVQGAWESFVFDRKPAAVVSGEFLDWLSARGERERPFFAFLNYSDAHTPYDVAAGGIHRFGTRAADERQREMIRRWGELDKIRIVSQDMPFMVDAYDDCVANLDEQLGRLIDKLEKRGELDRTWVIVASDHGESFGEHLGVFCHGTSLYETELHVPLLIVPPGGAPTGRIVTEAVSLRDLAATIVDVLGVESGSPFPGTSLASLWRAPAAGIAGGSRRDGGALSEVLPGLAINADAYGLPKKAWPLAAIDNGKWSYIRGQSDAGDELYDLENDKGERRNVAFNPLLKPILESMRRMLDKLTDGPLVPERFRR